MTAARGCTPHIAHLDTMAYYKTEGDAPAKCEFHDADAEACEKHGCNEPTEAHAALQAAEAHHHEAYTSEEEKAAHAEHIRKHLKMPGDVKNDPRVIYQKKAVVKQHWKLLRQQAKKEKQKKLQLKAFTNGK